VGLPLVVEFAKAGFHVTGYDKDERKVVACSQEGRVVHRRHPHGRARSPSSPPGKLTASTDEAVIRDADAVIVCVPTPLNKTKEPDISYIVSATDAICRHIHDDLVVVLESTTYPGTTRELVAPRLEAAGGRIGETVFLSFSPERVDPSNQTWQTHNTPKVIGGMTPACLDVSVALYGQILQKVVPVSSTDAAEMVKLLENTFRAVNIGLVNEVAVMCNKLGLDTSGRSSTRRPASPSASCPSIRARASAGTASRSIRSTCRGSSAR
jgi:UDP-N-acetyl-D-glucosamine dehydrogenase